MELVVGLVLAIAAGFVGTSFGFDRDRAFYPTMLIVVATYYDLFAIMSGGGLVLGVEAAISILFVAMAIIGFRTSLWLVVAGLVGHGVLDLVHPSLVENRGVPAWWPMFCMSFDVGAGVFLAWRLSQRPRLARQSQS